MAQKKQKQGKRTPAYSTDTMVVCMIVGLLLIALGVLIFLANALGMAGDVFDGLRLFSRGLCGALGIILPVIPVWGGVLVIMSIQRKPPMRPFLLAILLLVVMCTAASLLTFVGSQSLLDYFKASIFQVGETDTLPAYLTRAFDLGSRRSVGGGLMGMVLAWPLWKGLGAVFSGVVMILAAVVVFLFLIRLDVKGIWHKIQLRRDERRRQQEAQEAAARQQELAWAQ